ncbi:MAG: cystathionine gamma-synthase family protein [Bacteroidia bacterium]|nr:cystathionine gamma-synthase family protein [Bacteroidia bacterium]
MKHRMHPESLMMSYGYKPQLSEGAVKPPIFQTSTFCFHSAEEGKAFFELAYGLREKGIQEEQGLIYSRINNPNLEILENRLCLWDKAAEGAVFESGMSAISTVMLEFLKPGDLLLYSSPTYGGTDHFIHDYLKATGIDSVGFKAQNTKEEIIKMVKASGKADKLKLIFIESPANPTNDVIDIRMGKEIADYFSTEKNRVYVAVDNTYMGPVFCQPIKHGADIVIYSATKYLGGHSDLIAGAVLGSFDIIKRVKTLRTFIGNMPSPHTCWLLLRSLETLKIRMEQQMRNAIAIAEFLENHPKVKKIYYPTQFKEGSRAYEVFHRQYSSPGAMLSFDINGGEKEAFKFLNGLRLIKLAVSLGSTESLAQHPDTMTHAGVSPEDKEVLGITSSLIRLSVGIENHNDLIRDIDRALEAVVTEEAMTLN